ncbi:DEAD/DEAH box helicase [Paenibacillus athensensis]|uniref:DEAD/DEAH box helicase n=1 Tax=Paenibacillus athensensis TaxID=1967502 RepID=A0A4Y8Q6E4_9BACL|nr:DEAD/DEAH box helicase [Paenibacillus athensensis]MCD1259714.1 DEAD/DEAH box helicase [Paenibacillus athensensis]
MDISFEQLLNGSGYAARLRELGLTQPTPIQATAIPALRAGKDAIVQSQTGTGKTLAYVLPALERIDPQQKQLQALVLVPTRELGMQILQDIERLTAGGPLRAQSLIGGAALSRQVEKLKLHPHIAVGTPGRVLELLKLRKLSLHHVRTAVVDEVDQVFDLGSMHEVEALFKSMQRTSQIVFVSATIPDSLIETAGRWLKEPEHLHIDPEQRTAQTIEHLSFVCEERDKIDTLRRLVRLINPPSAIVFINATDDVAEVLGKLQFVGLSIEALYGEAGKQERARVMNAFRERRFQLLLATDIAARGLDIAGVTHVFHLDPAPNADYYLHRVGRTGRMGRKGTAISIITPREQFILDKFQKQLGIVIAPKAMYEGRIVDPAQDRSAAAMRSRREARQSGAPASARVHSHARPDAAPSGAGAAAADAGRGRSNAAAPAGSGVAGSPARGGAARANGRSGGPGAAPRAGAPAPRKAERERDRKNKGAPKWLKDKQSRD